MSNLKLEGDLSQIDEVQLNFIVNRLEDLGYKTNKVTVEPVGKLGDNFIANVKRITVYMEDEDTFKMIAKIAPQHMAARELMNTEIMFQNEIMVYEKVFPKFDELEKKAGIPETDRFKHPTCYGTLSEVPHEVLLLEDMTVAGYTTKDKMTPLDDETVKLLLKSLAHFHSLSYALKKQDIETFDSCNRLANLWAALDKIPQYKSMFSSMELQVMSMLDDEEAKKKCNGLIANSVADQASISKSDIKSKQSVILQGDGWTNNFLFKIEEDTVTTCLMIDYQLSRIANPAGDLLYMIFSCTDYETRKENYYDWIDYYYSELDKALFNFGLKAQSELPYDKFDADLRRYGRCSLSMCIMVLVMTLREGAEAKDIKNDIENKAVETLSEEMDIKYLKQETMARIVMRVRGAFASAIELGLI